MCIADEVYCGLGRVGSHFWGFELQGEPMNNVTYYTAFPKASKQPSESEYHGGHVFNLLARMSQIGT